MLGFFLEQSTEWDDVVLIQIFLDAFNVFSNLQPGSSSKITYTYAVHIIYFEHLFLLLFAKIKDPQQENTCRAKSLPWRDKKTKIRLKEGEVSEAKVLLKARTECVCENKNNA